MMGAEPGAAGACGPGARPGAIAVTGPREPRRVAEEVWLVLGLSLIPSALTAIVALVDRLTRDAAIGAQTATINAAVDERWIFDLLYRVISIGSGLVVVLLAVWLLRSPAGSGRCRLGIRAGRTWRDAGAGLAIAASIGIPGLALYLASRAAGLTPHVETNADALAPSTVVILLVAAARAALVEEVIVVGHLATRLQDLDWPGWRIVAASALLRGSYHLYQGVPMALGNVAMGIACALWFRRTGRVGPLVVAHFALDAVSFLGAGLAARLWPGLA